MVIDVEFVDIEIPRYILQKYGPKGGSAGDVGDWPARLKEVLQKYGCTGCERTFPVSYSWSRDTEESPQRKAIAAGRDRFISFHFDPNANASLIVEALMEVKSVAQAAPVSRLAPASPLEEPFVGTNDQVNPNHFCTAQECFQNQWYLFRCGVNHAWQLVESGISGKKVVIAVIGQVEERKSVQSS